MVLVCVLFILIEYDLTGFLFGEVFIYASC